MQELRQAFLSSVPGGSRGSAVLPLQVQVPLIPIRQPEFAGRNVNAERTLKRPFSILPPTERLLFLLRDVEGYTPAVIAQLLQMTEPQVQRGLFAARLRLRRALAEAQQAESKPPKLASQALLSLPTHSTPPAPFHAVRDRCLTTDGSSPEGIARLQPATSATTHSRVMMIKILGFVRNSSSLGVFLCPHRPLSTIPFPPIPSL